MNATTHAHRPTPVLPTLNLTNQNPPPADSKVRIISTAGKTITALIIPPSWSAPPHDMTHVPEPQDEAGRRLELQIRAIGLTAFEFHDYQDGDRHVRSTA